VVSITTLFFAPLQRDGMIKKVLAKTIAGTATAGLMLVPVTGTIAPQISTVACAYPDTVATTTNIKVAKSFQRQGQRNVATVTVRSGAGKPKGTVSFRVHTGRTHKAQLRNGRATFRIPTWLKAGRTYGIGARFSGACQFRDSRDTAFVTVFRKRGR
jgi:hypothetical protein